MTTQDKIWLYRKSVDEYKKAYCRQTGLSNRSGLCIFFSAMFEDDIITHNEIVFLREELQSYKKENHCADVYIWPSFDYEPRLEYLQNRLYHYQTQLQHESI